MPTRLKTFCVCALGLAMIPACEDEARHSRKAAPGDELFGSPHVINLALVISPGQLETLKTNKDSHAYVRCTWREGDTSLEHVAIRCNGRPAKEFATGKPDFTVTFDKFVPDQEFHGVERLVLQSSRDDPSYLSAPVATEMFRSAGVPAPRCSFARVALNGSDLGLYILVEGVNRDFLRQHFQKYKGRLYVYDEDHRTNTVGKFEKSGLRSPGGRSDLSALAAAVRQSDPDKRWEQLQQEFDMNRFMTFTALEVLLWKKDSYGYTLDARKVRIYHDPESDRMVFLPKGIERVLKKTDGPILPRCRGAVAHAALSTPEGRKEYRKAMEKLLETVFVPAKVQARAQELAALIRPAAVGNDPRAAKQFDAAVAEFNDAVTKRASFVAEQIKTLDELHARLSVEASVTAGQSGK